MNRTYPFIAGIQALKYGPVGSTTTHRGGREHTIPRSSGNQPRSTPDIRPRHSGGRQGSVSSALGRNPKGWKRRR